MLVRLKRKRIKFDMLFDCKKPHLFSVYFNKGNNFTQKPHTHKNNTVKITTLNAFDVGQLKNKGKEKENKLRLEQKATRNSKKTAVKQKLC